MQIIKRVKACGNVNIPPSTLRTTSEKIHYISDRFAHHQMLQNEILQSDIVYRISKT